MHLRAREKLTRMAQKDSHGRVIFRREKQNRIFHDLDFENREKYDLDFENREKYDLDVKCFLGTFRGQLDLHLRALELINTMLSMPTPQDPHSDLHKSDRNGTKKGRFQNRKSIGGNSFSWLALKTSLIRQLLSSQMRVSVASGSA